MRALLVSLVVLASASAAIAKEMVYEGSWVTTNRPLDGTMTCVVRDLGNNRWRGHFYGVWYGHEFSYEVDFSGPPENLQGTATIDGAEYEWTGEMGGASPRWFKGRFDGNRYR